MFLLFGLVCIFLFASGELYVIEYKMVVKVKKFVEDFSSEGKKQN